jgi:tetratricopeptide (TPR) repeat protein
MKNLLYFFSSFIFQIKQINNQKKGKGVALEKLNKLEDAIKCYNKAIDLNPNYPISFFNKGNLLRKQNKLEDALVCYDKAIDQDPNFVYALNFKGLTLTDLKKYEEAIQF